MDGLVEARLRPSIPQERLNYMDRYLQKKLLKVLQKTQACHHLQLLLSQHVSNRLPDVKISEASKEISSGKQEVPNVSSSPKASHTVTVKKPLGAKKTGKTGGLGARKLTTKPSENLYDQKPEEPSVQVSTSTNSTPTDSSSFTSRFEYVDNFQDAPMSSGGTHVLSHVAPPKSSSFFSDFGMDSGFTKKSGSNSSKIQRCPKGVTPKHSLKPLVPRLSDIKPDIDVEKMFF